MRCRASAVVVTAAHLERAEERGHGGEKKYNFQRCRFLWQIGAGYEVLSLPWALLCHPGASLASGARRRWVPPGPRAAPALQAPPPLRFLPLSAC